MQLVIDNLLDFDLKRLGRPNFKHDYPSLSEPINSQTHHQNSTPTGDESEDHLKRQQEWRDQGSSLNDVAYDGISSDQGLSFLTDIITEPIYMGETFTGLLTIINTSTLHSIDQLKVTVKLTKTKT